MITKNVFYKSVDNSGNWPDDPGNIPVKAEKTPDQVQACDSRPENAHDCCNRFVFIMCGFML